MITVSKMLNAILQYKSMAANHETTAVINGTTVQKNAVMDNLFYPFKFFVAALVIMLISDFIAEKVTDSFVLNFLVTMIIAFILTYAFCYLFLIYARKIIRKNNLPELF